MALRKLALMHRFFGVLDGHTCRECSNFIKGKYHDKVLCKCKVYGLTHKLTLRSEGVSTNPIITNLATFSFIKINGVINIGEYITIYRDRNNVLRAELTSGSTVTDVITWIDDESSLFELESGDNLISATDEEGGASLVATFTFNPARAVLYES